MRTVLITGATSGFGKLMVHEFLKNGDTVIATGRQLTQRPEIFAEERTEFSNSLVELDLDVTKEKEIQSAFSSVQNKFAGLDILINNAGYGLFGPIEDSSEDEIRHQMEVNFFGVVLVSKTFLPLLRKQQGKIFNISSAFGFTGFPLTGMYCASKFAVEGFSESLDYEVRPHGVQVCVIQPGAFRTKFGPNVVWTKTNTETIYKTQIENYQRILHSRISSPRYQDPADVAKGILKLSLKATVPGKVRFGKDSKFTHYFRTVTPEFVYRSVTSKVYNKLFFQKQKNS